MVAGGVLRAGRRAPLALWIRGDARHFGRLDRSVALVGARAATGYGEHVAMESAAGLSDRGFVIVSGGAYGIDAAAHRAALASEGVTVAFLAGGVDRLYPAGNSELLRRIASEGVLVAELPPGSAPTRWRFLMRNRLIAAAASATVVVEAGRRSGSLNTAGHAAQMGRPLGAVPGQRPVARVRGLPPADPRVRGDLRDHAGRDGGAGGPVREPELAARSRSRHAALLPEGGRQRRSGPVLSALSRVALGERRSRSRPASALPFTTVAAVLGRLDLGGQGTRKRGRVVADREATVAVERRPARRCPPGTARRAMLGR